MQNNAASVAIWLVNLLVAGAFVFFTYLFLMRGAEADVNASMPARIDELNKRFPDTAEVDPPAAWTDIKVQKGDGITRVLEEKWQPLYSQNYNRIIPKPVVTRNDPPPPKPVRPPAPTLEKALQELQTRVAVLYVFYPVAVGISIDKKPWEVRGSATAGEYIMISGERGDSPAVAADLSKVPPAPNTKPLTAKVIAIEESGLILRWTAVWPAFEEEPEEVFTWDIELLFGQERFPGQDTVFRPESGSQQPPNPFGTGGTSNNGGTRPNPNGTGGSSDPHTGGATDPAPTHNGIDETRYDEDTGVWWIANDELLDLKDSYESHINEVQVRPVYNPQTGGYEGLQLTQVPEQSLASRRGFKTGDRVISINGVSVNSVADVRNYLTSNKNLPQYDVVFERDGVQQRRIYRTQN